LNPSGTVTVVRNSGHRIRQQKAEVISRITLCHDLEGSVCPTTSSDKERMSFVTSKKPVVLDPVYSTFVNQLVGLLEQTRRNSARSVNAIMTSTYWEVGRRIVEQEQRGKKRAQYGKALLRHLADASRFGKGFSERNLLAMREFYLS
jgi:hypothetical protein